MKFTRGFTLFEMMVSIAIFTLLTTTILVKNSQFKSVTSTTNLAYQVALAYREAQQYGVNVRRATSIPGAADEDAFAYKYPYGIHVDSATNDSLLLFADTYNDSVRALGSDGLFVSVPSGGGTLKDTTVRSYALKNGNTISKFCVDTTSPSTRCSNDASNPLTSLDVTFVRPFPDANFQVQVSGGGALPTGITSAKICVVSPQGTTKGVRVSSVGQIEVLDICP